MCPPTRRAPFEHLSPHCIFSARFPMCVHACTLLWGTIRWYSEEPWDVTSTALVYWQASRLATMMKLFKTNCIRRASCNLLGSSQASSSFQVEHRATYTDFSADQYENQCLSSTFLTCHVKGNYWNKLFVNCGLSNVNLPGNVFQSNSLCCTTIQFSFLKMRWLFPALQCLTHVYNFTEPYLGNTLLSPLNAHILHRPHLHILFPKRPWTSSLEIHCRISAG